MIIKNENDYDNVLFHFQEWIDYPEDSFEFEIAMILDDYLSEYEYQMPHHVGD